MKHLFGTLSAFVLIACACPAVAGPAETAPEPTITSFNVKLAGARGDGSTLDTAAITKAIVAANAAGGGTVVFPPGTYLSGTLELLSNVTLEFLPGAVLEGSPDVNDYGSSPDYGIGTTYGVDSSGEGQRVGLIIARKANNIAIIGRGAIDGNGDSFFDLNSTHNGMDYDPSYTRQGDDYDSPKYGLDFGPVETRSTGRPGTMIILLDCRNILIRDVTLRNAPNWTLHLQNSQQAAISGIHIDNNVLLPNNDGIDCMHCKHIHVSDSDIRAGDDDFAIVSSEDVNVNNCSLFSYSAAIRLEDTRYSTFSNLSIHANRGLGIFGRIAGEHTAHVLFSNITMETNLITGHWWGKAEPIYIAARGGNGTAEVRDVHFNNITIEAESGMMIYGSPDTLIRDIYLEQVRMHVRAPQQRIAQSVGGNFDLRWTGTLAEAIFKHDIPALYVRYLDGLHIRDFDVSWGDNLPSYFSKALEVEDSKNLDYGNFKPASAPTAAQ